MALQTISFEEYQNIEGTQNGIIIFDFWNDGCGVCKNLEPVLVEISNERSDVTIYSVKASDEEEFVSKFSVMTTPTLVFVKDGKVGKKTIGYKSKESLLGIIEQL